MVGQPGVGQLVLHAIREGLVEQAEVVTQTHAVAGQVEGGQRIQEAGGQAAQTAVAKARLRLNLLNVGQVLARSGQSVADVIVQP